MTTHATKIRQALKIELGLTSRQVSVKTGQGGLSSAVDVEIKVPGVKVADVEKVASLASSPRFLAMDLADALTESTENALRRWLETLPVDSSCHRVPSSETCGLLTVCQSQRFDYTVWKDDQAHAIGSGNDWGVAAIIARRFVEAGQTFTA